LIGNYHFFEILSFGPSLQNNGRDVAPKSLWKREVGRMGMDMVSACLRALLFNKAAQEKKIRCLPEGLKGHTLCVTSAKGQEKKTY
jgi:hypothetical protein